MTAGSDTAAYTCPDGHPSASADYCDVCGAPIGAAGSSAAPGPQPLQPPAGVPLDAPPGRPVGVGDAGAGPRVCPNCSYVNAPGALFCEDCGYDFVTGQLPPADGPLSAPTPGDPAVSSGPGPLAPPAPLLPPVAPPPADGHTPSSGVATTVEWVAEVWVDPDWYAAQDVPDPMPSAGMPVVVPLAERSVLVGRRSASRNIHPQVDLGADNGVSRRHAQLTTDGQRWFVEDLQSSNGTYVGDSGAPLPTTPIAPGQKVELDDDDRVYLGAWTRVVVRRAGPGERTTT